MALTPCNNDFSVWHHSIEPLNTHDKKNEVIEADHQKSRLAMQWWQQETTKYSTQQNCQIIIPV